MAAPAFPCAPATACTFAARVAAAAVCVGAVVAPERHVLSGQQEHRRPPVLSAAQTSEPRAIEVLAKRFAFEPAVIQVAVGEPVRLIVRSGDGVHGIAIKSLGIAREIPRGGMAVTIDFVAAEAGRFPIVCSEYCGSGHEDMNGMLVVRAHGAPER